MKICDKNTYGVLKTFQNYFKRFSILFQNRVYLNIADVKIDQ